MNSYSLYRTYAATLLVWCRRNTLQLYNKLSTIHSTESENRQQAKT